MSHRTTPTAILISLALVAAGAWAEEAKEAEVAGEAEVAEVDIVDYVVKSCQAEIESYCSQVTIGEGRLLACFYAHGDKLSGRCEYALYNAAAQLEQFAVALTYLATECRDDLEEHCSEVELGEGRVATCLLERKEKVTEACRLALDAIDLEVVEE